jgi:hypothetical protein
MTPSVLVRYTYYGDTDFNGKVNFDDYVRTDNGFNNHLTGWLNGDFDLNGTVNFDDYVLIDLAFNTQSGTLRRALAFLDGHDRSDVGMNESALRMIAAHFRHFGNGYASSFLNAVPEPIGIVPLVLAGVMLTRRRPGRYATVGAHFHGAERCRKDFPNSRFVLAALLIGALRFAPVTQWWQRLGRRRQQQQLDHRRQLEL